MIKSNFKHLNLFSLEIVQIHQHCKFCLCIAGKLEWLPNKDKINKIKVSRIFNIIWSLEP